MRESLCSGQSVIEWFELNLCSVLDSYTRLLFTLWKNRKDLNKNSDDLK